MKPKIEGLCPMLQVFDMPASIAFYRNVFGFEVAKQSPPLDDRADNCNWALLRQEQAELMLNTLYEAPERPSAPEPARHAAHGDTALYFGCRDVDGVYSYLRAKGIEAREPVVTHYGMKQLYLRDPDGYVLCIQWPAA
jgi:catechol 2,3-dioxygenase-like lactoylglutathione lyase family enzyme